MRKPGLIPGFLFLNTVSNYSLLTIHYSLRKSPSAARAASGETAAAKAATETAAKAAA